jgi:hypothetical protein
MLCIVTIVSGCFSPIVLLIVYVIISCHSHNRRLIRMKYTALVPSNRQCFGVVFHGSFGTAHRLQKQTQIIQRSCHQTVPTEKSIISMNSEHFEVYVENITIPHASSWRALGFSGTIARLPPVS